MTFTAEVRESLTHISDAALDRVTSSASVFFDRRWFRLLDAMDLAPLVRGEVALRYVVVSRGTEPVAVCPFLVTRSESIYLPYSFKRYYFAWQDLLPRDNLTPADWIKKRQRISRMLAAYRGVARATGVRTDGWVLAVSPLSLRGDIALAGTSPEDDELARRAVTDTLQEVAREERLPLCFFGVQEDKAELRQALRQQGFHELFLMYDNLLPVPEGSFADYLGRFRSKPRYKMNGEMAEARAAGVRFEVTREFGAMGASLTEMYNRTYARYGEEYLDLSASFWAAVERHMAPCAEATIAYCGREPIGFVLRLRKGAETWGRFVGRSYDSAAAEAPVYFNLTIYEAVRRALELGARRHWLGPGASEAKRQRGAVAHTLYSYLWFPRRWARALLVPYLERFSHGTRRLLAAQARSSSILKTPVTDAAASPELHATADPTSGSGHGFA